MTKKDYIIIAANLNAISKRIDSKELSLETPDKLFNLIVESLSDVLQADNEKYQRYMFLEAVYNKTKL